MKLRDRIFSLMLLMVVAVSAVGTCGLCAHTLFHLQHSCECSESHHCDGLESGHDTHMKHQCADDLEILNTPPTVQRVQPRVSLIVAALLCEVVAPAEQNNHLLGDWREYALYCGDSHSTRSLRAPPVFI